MNKWPWHYHVSWFLDRWNRRLFKGGRAAVWFGRGAEKQIEPFWGLRHDSHAVNLPHSTITLRSETLGLGEWVIIRGRNRAS